MASLLFPDEQQQPGAQGLLAIPSSPSGDWRDVIAPQPSAADAADATAREYRAAIERDRQSQIDQGYVNPQTGERTPEGWRQQAQVIGGGFGPADIGVAGGLLGTIKPSRIPFYQHPANVHEAKYIMPDGKLVGAGDNTHEYLAHSMGYGTGDAGVNAMQKETGAVRINVADAMFGGGGDVSIHGTPTQQQMRQLAKYVNQRETTGIGHGDKFKTVRNGGELRRLIMGTDHE